MDLDVNPECSPFLVSAAKAQMLWVPEAKDGHVRAAFRDGLEEGMGSYYREIVEAIREMGVYANWENVFPLSKDGITAAIEHVESYEMGDLDLLANPDLDWSLVSPDFDKSQKSMVLMYKRVPISPASWLPPDRVIIVPRDRSYLGMYLQAQGRFVSLVHNAARAIGIACLNAPLPWNKGMKREELMRVAHWRGIEFGDKVTRKELFSLLEADDARVADQSD